MEALPSRHDSWSDRFRSAAWNVAVGTAVIAGTIWGVLHLPGVLPTCVSGKLAA